jgi:DNA polymerase (family 10)
LTDHSQVADALKEIGRMLELLGENPFKTRAYHNGARIIRALEDDLEDLVQQKALTQLKGIGPALAEKISTLVTTGQLPYLEELRKKMPDGLMDWLLIPGLGTSKARTIHVSLGISTLGELEYACNENRLRDLAGFGEKTQQKILSGIGLVKRHAGRFLQPLLQAEAVRLLALLRGLPGVERAELTGPVRRLAETSRTIDILAASNTPAQVHAAFAESAAGSLEQGPLCELRVVPGTEFVFALAALTGTDAHNTALREQAQRSGFALDEHGLKHSADGDGIACGSEEDLFSVLGMQVIAPELREDETAVVAATAGTLPNLITTSDLAGALHCHSRWSDGATTIAELAEATRALGLTYLGLCDHSQAASYAGGLNAARVREQHIEIDQLNAQYGDSFRILKGTEVDILADGSLDFPDDLLASFDIVVASVHSRFNLSHDEQTQRIIKALGNPYVDILGHPTGRLLLARDGYSVDLHRVIDVAIEHNVAIEVNAHPRRLDIDWRHLLYGRERGLKTSVNTDAHSIEGLQNAVYGVGVARKAWCSTEDVLNAWPLDRLLTHLQARRTHAGV